MEQYNPYDKIGNTIGYVVESFSKYIILSLQTSAILLDEFGKLEGYVINASDLDFRPDTKIALQDFNSISQKLIEAIEMFNKENIQKVSSFGNETKTITHGQ
jgi:hypothetical protein